jgi:mitogen-activated protein kinase kinase
MSNNSSSSVSNNWREDIARIVHHDPEDHTDTSLGDLKPDDFTNIQRLGEGAAGTVWKVRHNPSQLVMAKKVKFKRNLHEIASWLLNFLSLYIDNHS